MKELTQQFTEAKFKYLGALLLWSKWHYGTEAGYSVTGMSDSSLLNEVSDDLHFAGTYF